MYTKGLKGEENPLSASLMALADVYDALVSKRVYKDAMETREAKDIIVSGRGKHFDPEILDSFLKIENKFRGIKEQYKDDDL